jgi:phosphopantetheinyl transferase (holo-ACP synthase)
MSRKPKKGAKPKNTAKAKTPPAARPKLTAEQLSDRERERLAHNHKQKLKPLLAAEKLAKAAVAKAKELAKKEGVPWKDIELLLKLETEEGAEKVRLDMERLLRLDRWAGAEIGVQLELTFKPKPAEKAYDDGRRAALVGDPRRPPLHLSDSDAKHWIAGHENGSEQQNKANAQHFKPLGDAASNVTKIGDAAPTHKETGDGFDDEEQEAA